MSAPFRSFWMAGFESACHINGARCRLDMIQATQHDAQVADDYARLRALGLLVAREGARWHLIERTPRRYEFGSLRPFLEAAAREGIQVVWNLFHYGWPDDLDIFAPAFVDRFAAFARAVARVVADHSDDVPLYAPVNEISFVAWAGGEKAYFHPFCRGRGGELKRQLVRAAVAATEAVWDVDRRARMVHTDPLIRVIAPRDRPDLAEAAAAETEAQHEARDMLAGRSHPELGGRPAYLDIIGLNYYHANQWEYPDRRLRWEDDPRDQRWAPLSALLAAVARRYGRPMILSETSHFGSGRARWIREIAAEARRALDAGTPLEGVCIYPVLDRPDWDDPYHWHHSGLWDVRRESGGRLERLLNPEYAGALADARRLVG
ncbi:MAG TPA: hypothetical protein VFK09_04710 [Gemmatimonadales bacterium]|nr:hypothetical protein [Gemmatimonadales bacterium]